MNQTHGHLNINQDDKTISYDLNVRIPFVADFIVTRQDVDSFVKKIEGEDSLRLTTAGDFIRFRNLPFSDVPYMINRLQMIIDDLESLETHIKPKE